MGQQEAVWRCGSEATQILPEVPGGFLLLPAPLTLTPWGAWRFEQCCPQKPQNIVPAVRFSCWFDIIQWMFLEAKDCHSYISIEIHHIPSVSAQQQQQMWVSLYTGCVHTCTRSYTPWQIGSDAISKKSVAIYLQISVKVPPSFWY